MDPKVKRLTARYEQLKKKVRNWEHAIFTTECRKPGKDDMKSAPTDVQSSYRELVKIRKYLENAVSGVTSARKKHETPSKIFIPNRRLFHRVVSENSSRPLFRPSLFKLKKENENSVNHDDVSSRKSEENSADQSKSATSLGNRLQLQSVDQLVPKKKFFPSFLKNTNTSVDEDDKNDDSLSRRSLQNNYSGLFQRSHPQPLQNGHLNRPAPRISFLETSDKVEICIQTHETPVQTLPNSSSSIESEDVFVHGNKRPFSAAFSPEKVTSYNEDDIPQTTDVSTHNEVTTTKTDNISGGNKKRSFNVAFSPSPEKVNNNDETSESTNVSPHTENADDSVSEKRPFSFALSPSPKKPASKRKFFRAKEGRATRAVFSFNSYRPLSPLKKIKTVDSASNKQKPAKIRKITPSTPRTRSKTVNEGNEDLESEMDSPSPKRKVPKTSVEARKQPNRTTKAVNYKEDEMETTNSDDKSTAAKSYVIDVFDEESQPVITKKKKMGRRFNAKKQTLESKLASGKVEDNYVRINTEKKVFVRGHKRISAVKMKRLDWKRRKTIQGKETATNTFTCHKCGEKGHFAKFCSKDMQLTEEPPGEQDDSPFPTLEEAARMVNTGGSQTSRVNVYMLNKLTEEVNAEEKGDEVTENTSNDVLISSEMSEPVVNSAPLIESLDPFFDGESTVPTDQEMEIMLEGIRTFGYEDFRPGQREAIYRVLKGLSTLVILSTGSGKSLCYQLPAYFYHKKYPGALTLCISPLVSLMEDQVLGVPTFLNAACLHSGMTAKQKSVVLDRIKARKLHILLVSPEAVCGGLFGLLKGNNEDLPKISFACIDEVHCVSQWSHNFRPSYLQLCKILREKLHVKTILGLTATATEATSTSVCEHLNIDPSTTIRGELIPRNLKLSVSRDVYKDEALLNLLRGERFRECDSIIIYCTRREECERIATLVRIKMQEVSTHKVIKSKSGARLSSSCEAYHAGMTARRRKNVQNGFMSGDIRIVVATVAFGMGIDKSDIRAVIHYNMPSTFESYVQEIGRAGRDGLPAHCHLFLDNSRRNDLCELKRHVYANSVDRPTIRKLLRRVFQPCKCGRIEKLRGNTESDSSNSNSNKVCPGHEVSFSIEDTVNELDLPKENITTLLCYLELGEKKWIEILPLTYERCKIQAYGGAKLFKSAASRCPPLAVAIALQKEKNKFRDTDTYLEFNVIEAAATVGWNSSIVKKELKNLEWIGSQFDEKGNPTKFRKSGLLVEFSSLAYRVRSSNLNDQQADEVLNCLHGRNLRQEQTELYQLRRVYEALLSVSFPNVNNLCDSFDEEKSNQLKAFIYDYFTETSENIQSRTEALLSDETQLDPGKDDALRRSIRQLIDSNRDINFTTRSIARIFQGISSPCFPADVWYRNKDFWRRYLDIDFHLICRIAAEEL